MARQTNGGQHSHSNPPRVRPQQARARRTVEYLLDAALSIIANEGYDAFNTNLVATRAGVSVGTVYRYFPDKRQLVGALLQRHTDLEIAALTDTVSHSAALDLPGVIDKLVSRFILLNTTELRPTATLWVRLPAADWNVELDRGHEDLARIWKIVLHAWSESTRIPSADRAARLVATVTRSVVSRAALDPAEGIDETAHELTDLVTRFLSAIPPQMGA